MSSCAACLATVNLPMNWKGGREDGMGNRMEWGDGVEWNGMGGHEVDVM